MTRFALLVCGVLLASGVSASGRAADWAQWRGPGHNNIAPAGESVPTEWSDSENVRWRTKVPGRGHSSPIVIGDLVVLTSADERNEAQAVLAFDRRSGEQVWLRPVSQGGFPKTHVKNTHASPTPAAAGGLICATFCHHGRVEAVALNHDGEEVWRTNVGPFQPKIYEYGYAASPTIHGDLLIVAGSCDTSAWMKALRLTSGEIVWQQQRPKVLNWASPIVTELQGRQQLLISGGSRLASYDPASGQPLWSASCLTMATAGTCVWSDGIVLASGGFPDAQTVAVAADGSGRVLWSNKVKCYEQSMMAHDGYLYALADSGVAYCWNVKTSEEMWKKRLSGPVSASPLLVGDNIFAANEKGMTFVFKASPEKFQPVARNRLGNESFASPAVADNVMYLRVAQGRGARRQEVLYAIAGD